MSKNKIKKEKIKKFFNWVEKEIITIKDSEFLQLYNAIRYNKKFINLNNQIKKDPSLNIFYNNKPKIYFIFIKKRCPLCNKYKNPFSEYSPYNINSIKHIKNDNKIVKNYIKKLSKIVGHNIIELCERKCMMNIDYFKFHNY